MRTSNSSALYNLEAGWRSGPYWLLAEYTDNHVDAPNVGNPRQSRGPTDAQRCARNRRIHRTHYPSTENIGSEPSGPVDIAEYRALTADVTLAVIELTKLVDSPSGVTDSRDDIVAIVNHITNGQDRVLNHLLVILLISIAFFIICLSGYRLVAAKTKRL